MSIFDSLKQFGGNVISGIGNVFASAVNPAPTVTRSTPSLTSTITQGLSGLINTAFSGIARFVNPQDRPLVSTPTPPTPVFIVGSGATQDSTAATQTGTAPAQTILGVPQKTALLIAAGLVGFLVFRRIKF